MARGARFFQHRGGFIEAARSKQGLCQKQLGDGLILFGKFAAGNLSQLINCHLGQAILQSLARFIQAGIAGKSGGGNEN